MHHQEGLKQAANRATTLATVDKKMRGTPKTNEYTLELVFALLPSSGQQHRQLFSAPRWAFPF